MCLRVRMGEADGPNAAERMLVVIGPTPRGQEGARGLPGRRARERARRRRELLIELEARGLAAAPEIAVGEGAMGFWRALDALLPGTRHQRRRQRKAAHALNKAPRSGQPGMKAAPREVRDAPDRAAARAAVAAVAEKRGANSPEGRRVPRQGPGRAAEGPRLPGQRWNHLRTANPVESVFATVRHRIARTKGALSQTTARPTVCELVTAASRSRRRLQRENRPPMALASVTSTDGLATTAHDRNPSPGSGHGSGVALKALFTINGVRGC